MPSASVELPPATFSPGQGGTGSGVLESTGPADQSVSRKRALIWALAMTAYFMVVYNGCTWSAMHRARQQLHFDWESKFIPFVAAAIFPYMSIDLFFFFSPFLCRDRRELRTLTRRIILAITIAGICFLVFPLEMGTQRPPVTRGLTGALYSLLGAFDQPTNLIPSLHVGLLCVLWVIYSRHSSAFLRVAIQGWFVLIALSTLLTWQHHVMDLVGGLFLGLICLYIIPDGKVPWDSDAAPGGDRIRNYRVATNYAAGTAILLMLGFLYYPWGLMLLWPALSGVLVSAAYFFLDARIFRKTNGRLPLSSQILFGPYLLIAGMCHRHIRAKCDPYVEVSQGVWVGGRLNASQSKELLDQGVVAVLDLTGECSESPAFLKLNYLNLPLLDLTPPTLEELKVAVAFIQKYCDRGVYVHCALGVSRSVCVVVGYILCAQQHLTVDDSYNIIRDLRSVAVLKPLARRTLEAYRVMLQQ